MQSNLSETHAFLVSVLRATPNYIPLKYRCLSKRSIWIRVVYLGFVVDLIQLILIRLSQGLWYLFWSRINFRVWYSSLCLDFSITLFNHRGWFHDPSICQIHYVPPPPNKIRIIMYYLYIQPYIWKFGWSYTPNTIHMNHVHPILLTWNGIHTCIIHWEYCS